MRSTTSLLALALALAAAPAALADPSQAAALGQGLAAVGEASSTGDPTLVEVEHAISPEQRMTRALEAGHVGVATSLLRLTGFYRDSIFQFHRRFGARSPTEAGLRALVWSRTGRRPDRRVEVSEPQVARWLVEAATQSSQARARRQGTPHVSVEADREGFEAGLGQAAARLSHVRAGWRRSLLGAVFSVQGVDQHWSQHIAEVTHDGRIGYAGVRLEEAARLGGNPYSPTENLVLAAERLNLAIGEGGSVGEGVARYFGADCPDEAARAMARRVFELARRAGEDPA